MELKKKIVDIFLNVYMYPINLIIERMKDKHRIAFQTKLFKCIKDTDHYVNLSFFPIHVADIVIGRQTERDCADTTIILQGPIAEKNNFTLETVELYMRYYKNINIVVSTWENAAKKDIAQLESMGVKVLLNSYPSVNGVGNINYQLVSALNGVREAQKNCSEYVWKTRTDQRYYNPCALPCLINSLGKKRLVMLGGINNSFVKRAFHISDFMAFGSVDEIIRLYSCQLDDEDSSKTKYIHKNQINDKFEFNHYILDIKKAENGLLELDDKYNKTAIKYGNPETLITYCYYKVISGDVSDDCLLAKYMDFLKKEVAIIDADNLGFFWPKYDYDSIRQTYFDRTGKLDFARWCSLMIGDENE